MLLQMACQTVAVILCISVALIQLSLNVCNITYNCINIYSKGSLVWHIYIYVHTCIHTPYIYIVVICGGYIPSLIATDSIKPYR
jgi:hypothetical protein